MEILVSRGPQNVKISIFLFMVVEASNFQDLLLFALEVISTKYVELGVLLSVPEPPPHGKNNKIV